MMMQAISFLNFENASFTASLLFSGQTMVSFTNASGTPAEEVFPKVTKPEPPFSTDDFIASTTFGFACPRISGPQEQQKSMYSFPSASQICEPFPRSMN